MKKEYKFSSVQGGKSIVILKNDQITIKRKGIFAFLNYGLKGEKTIFLRNITGIQLKEAKIAVGYLQFIIIGSQESKGGLRNAMKDENTIVFGGGFHDKKMNKDAQEIKTYIENYLINVNKPNMTEKSIDKYDKLSKIKKLLDEGILTQQEFEEEKKKILK